MRPALFTLVLGTALAAAPACFNPPAGQVQFSCEPEGGSACPDGYECRSDGCCHRQDSPEGDTEGACKLGGFGAETASGSSSSTGATSTGGATGGTGATGTAGSSSTSTSTSTGPQTTGAS
jgi:hypothetical protein